jgi:hypothetical protein
MSTTRIAKPQQQNSEKVHQNTKPVADIMLALQFVTFRLKGCDKNMRQINPFCVQKTRDSITGKV